VKATTFEVIDTVPVVVNTVELLSYQIAHCLKVKQFYSKQIGL